MYYVSTLLLNRLSVIKHFCMSGGIWIFGQNCHTTLNVRVVTYPGFSSPVLSMINATAGLFVQCMLLNMSKGY